MVSKVAKAYLIVYNISQFVGWCVILTIGVKHLLRNGGKCNGLWKSAEHFIQIFQTLAVLEIFHNVIRIVPSNPFVTTMQVSSRLLVVWGILFSVPQVANTTGVSMLFLAWSITEVVRYSFYLCKLVDWCPYLITWCRYSFFYALYPCGVLGEMSTIYMALPYVKSTRLYSLTLPNQLNTSFSYYLSLIVIITLYLPGFPFMYKHMIRQRSKVITGDVKKNKQK